MDCKEEYLAAANHLINNLNVTVSHRPHTSVW